MKKLLTVSIILLLALLALPYMVHAQSVSLLSASTVDGNGIVTYTFRWIADGSGETSALQMNTTRISGVLMGWRAYGDANITGAYDITVANGRGLARISETDVSATAQEDVTLYSNGGYVSMRDEFWYLTIANCEASGSGIIEIDVKVQ
jgi:hypothetical protein